MSGLKRWGKSYVPFSSSGRKKLIFAIVEGAKVDFFLPIIDIHEVGPLGFEGPVRTHPSTPSLPSGPACVSQATKAHL